MASVWTYVPPAAPTPTVDDLGSALRRFHALGPPPFPLAHWDPIGDARRRLADADGLTAEDHDYLMTWCDRLEPQVADLNQRVEQSLIHGDAHVGNLLRDASGGILLCDFDATCLGPWQVDLAAVAVGEARFGKTGTHRALAEAYEYDVMSDRNWPLLREARELKMIAAATPLLASSASVAAEFAKRLQSIAQGDHGLRWKPFADLVLRASRRATAARWDPVFVLENLRLRHETAAGAEGLVDQLVDVYLDAHADDGPRYTAERYEQQLAAHMPREGWELVTA